VFDFFNDFFGEIKKGTFRYQVDSGNKIAVEGYKNVLKIDDKCIVLKLFNGELEIIGMNLKVKELCTNTIIISGSIKSINQVGEVWKTNIEKFMFH